MQATRCLRLGTSGFANAKQDLSVTTQSGNFLTMVRGDSVTTLNSYQNSNFIMSSLQHTQSLHSRFPQHFMVLFSLQSRQLEVGSQGIQTCAFSRTCAARLLSAPRGRPGATLNQGSSE